MGFKTLKAVAASQGYSVTSKEEAVSVLLQEAEPKEEEEEETWAIEAPVAVEEATPEEELLPVPLVRVFLRGGQTASYADMYVFRNLDTLFLRSVDGKTEATFNMNVINGYSTMSEVTP